MKQTDTLKRLNAGKTVVACGPLGVFDENGRRDPMFPEIRLPEIVRMPRFPHDTWDKVEPARCENEPVWRELTKNLFWHPQRMQDGLALKMPFPGTGQKGWYLRKFRDGLGRLLIHGIVSRYDLKLDDALEAKRSHKNNNSILTEILPKEYSKTLRFPAEKGAWIELIYPLNGGKTRALPEASFEVEDGVYYFILRITNG